MPSPAKLARIMPEVVAPLWPYARPLIKRAIDRTRLSDFERIEREVLAGLQALWLAHNGAAIEAAAVTQLTEVAGRKVCTIVACGGAGRERWLSLIAGLEEYARAEGCAATRIIGRRGWERVLDGYGLKFVILEKEI